MTNKAFYGALGVLVIVFIGICAYFIVSEIQFADMRSKHEVYIPELNKDAEQQKQHEDNPIVVENENPFQSVEDQDVQVPEVSDENKQQNDGVQSDLFDDSEFDFAVKLPTDDELPKYNERELSILLRKALTEMSDVQGKYEVRSESIMKELGKLTEDQKVGKSIWPKWRELSKQQSELSRIYRLRHSEQFEQIERIQQYRDTLY